MHYYRISNHFKMDLTRFRIAVSKIGMVFPLFLVPLMATTIEANDRSTRSADRQTFDIIFSQKTVILSLFLFESL
jgi:hypothetical protein